LIIIEPFTGHVSCLVGSNIPFQFPHLDWGRLGQEGVETVAECDSDEAYDRDQGEMTRKQDKTSYIS